MILEWLNFDLIVIGGAYAGEIIWGGAQMLEMQLRVTDARQIIFSHPTVSEIIREVLREFDDKKTKMKDRSKDLSFLRFDNTVG